MNVWRIIVGLGGIVLAAVPFLIAWLLWNVLMPLSGTPNALVFIVLILIDAGLSIPCIFFGVLMAGAAIFAG